MSVNIDVTVTCKECGAELALTEKRTGGYGSVAYEAEPCARCLDRAREVGRAEAESE